MFNRILPAVALGICCVFTVNTNATADCGCNAPVVDSCCDSCNATPCCCRTRTKKFQKVKVQKTVCRLRRVCVTDECGCSRMKLKRVPVCVTRTKLVRVNDCCKPSFCDRIRSRKACCDCPPADCGCGCN